tara:strand:+ start:376 stop:1104 length:729 start_codon:yes stop_codon:yes gene_type:complete
MQNLKINSLFSINKKVCVVSGSSGGLGNTVCKCLLRNGAVVIGLDIKKTKINNKKFFFYNVDLQNKYQLKLLKQSIKKKFKNIDSIVNLAGVSNPVDFELNIKNNLIGPYNLINILKDIFTKSTGSIVNITSLNAELGFSNNPGYNSSKGGLKMLSKALANDLAKLKIRVNNIGPGYFLTNMTKKFYNIKKKREQRLGRIPLKRYGKTNELCGAVIFFISEASSYVTGQDLYIDGGLLHKGI